MPRIVPAGLALVFDFGGTLDLCVTRRDKGEIRVLGTAGVDVAGGAMHPNTRGTGRA